MTNSAAGGQATGAQSLAGRRVLVTGGSGFIGRQVVCSLSSAEASVRVLDLEPHPDPAVDVVIGDLADPRALETALAGGFDSVVHLAAVTSVLRSLEHPALTYRTNVAGTAALLEAARGAGVRALVFASTNAVTGPMQAPKISETAALRPLTPYGSTKAAAEMLMSAYTASYGVRCACLRLTNVYGPGMQAKDSIVARLMRAIRLGSTFEIYGDGRQLRDYVHAGDVVGAITLALLDDRWQGPVVIGSGNSLSVLEVVEAVRGVSGAELPVRHGPAKPGEMPAVIVDTARARSLGWVPRFTLAEGLAGVWNEWATAEVQAPAGVGGGTR
ncbi:MAG: NAD-dependent epimerase/dehydratase family protein [Solirubrobacterales bacterium]|nr:NAD-dependent epimerase/dehydratase family protein [Solirubrobacterales bacterium]MBV9838743.1 NAD-dependent epimerase/dehydratase family protein [Solirubrobacterales bacterium]